MPIIFEEFLKREDFDKNVTNMERFAFKKKIQIDL